jgi:hypothetical protein
VKRLPFRYKNKTLHTTIDDDVFATLQRRGAGISYAPGSRDGEARPVIFINGKQKYLSRWIMRARRGQIIDHANGDQCDNRRCNLRRVTKAQNAMNSRKRRGRHTSKYRGVCKFNGRWHATITANGKQRLIGLFDSQKDAARAWNFAAKVLHGEYAQLNKIPYYGRR